MYVLPSAVVFSCREKRVTCVVCCSTVYHYLVWTVVRRHLMAMSADYVFQKTQMDMVRAFMSIETTAWIICVDQFPERSSSSLYLFPSQPNLLTLS